MSAIAPTKLEMSDTPVHNERFEKRDFVAALLVFIITFSLYLATLAPCVTLEDSGELITGAVTFGVPHPPGYPLWTLSGFIFSRIIPFGNIAWRVNIQSAFYGSAANAIITLLIAHSGRWLLQRWAPFNRQATLRPYSFYAAMIGGLTLGFSDVMWSQSVIAEVYSLNAFFLSLVLITFYFWVLRPERWMRLILCVFVFGIGLTNHHTLIQIIPAFLFASLLLSILKKQPWIEFWTLFVGVNLFSLSILTFLSWLSREEVPVEGQFGHTPDSPLIGLFKELQYYWIPTPHLNEALHTGSLHTVSELMAWFIMIFTLIISVLFMRKFSPAKFCLGAGIMLAMFLYGHFFWAPAPPPGSSDAVEADYMARNAFGSFTHSGWTQISAGSLPFVVFSMLAIGSLYTSTLNWRMVQAMFFAGWLGLIPYSYELLASSTHPPMNWGYVSGPGGFYYAVTRAQYPMSLPNLIKDTIGKHLGVVSPKENPDSSIGQPDYLRRLALTFQYYIEDLVDFFTAPLIFFPFIFLIYLFRANGVQFVWIGFMGVAIFTLGFMLHIIEPPQSFDLLSGENYKVFFLQSHCILAMFIGYGTLAGIVFLYEILDAKLLEYGHEYLGGILLFLTLIPLLGSFDDCNQNNHWFGWQYGYDILSPLPKGAIFFGGNDPGRFVPTYMVFGESQQPDRWKHDPSFDRRDIYVITQNALCDPKYLQYILDQYDSRYLPTHWTPFEKWLGREHNYPKETINLPTVDDQTLIWKNYYASPRALRVRGMVLPNEELFFVNGEVAKEIFDRNPDREFYIEQSSPIEWMQKYLTPDGLIMKLNHKPLDKIPPEMWAKDHEFWLNYAGKLLGNPNYLVDTDACHWYSTLAYNHAVLAQYRDLPQEVEFYDKLAILLCPYLIDPVASLADLYRVENRYDDAIAVMEEAERHDPRNDAFAIDLDQYRMMRDAYLQEKPLATQIEKNPNDLAAILKLAEVLEIQDKMGGKIGAIECLRAAARSTNWTPETEGSIIGYYTPEVIPRGPGPRARKSRPAAVVAFLREREKMEPTVANLPYTIAEEELYMGDTAGALNDLKVAIALGGEITRQAALNEPFFGSLRPDPEFEKLVRTPIRPQNPLGTTNQTTAPGRGPNSTNQIISTNAASGVNAPPQATPRPTSTPAPTKVKAGKAHKKS